MPFDPAHHRIFVRFRDAQGAVRGATSVAADTIELGGVYSGTLTVTQTGCIFGINNGTRQGSFSLTMPPLTRPEVTGVATASILPGQVVDIAFSGDIGQFGDLAGSFTFAVRQGAAIVAAGDGAWTGLATGNRLTLEISGQFHAGETCTITGSRSGAHL